MGAISIKEALNYFENNYNLVKSKEIELYEYVILDKYKCFNNLTIATQEVYKQEYELTKELSKVLLKKIDLFKTENKELIGV